jgi:hypothetical protein
MDPLDICPPDDWPCDAEPVDIAPAGLPAELPDDCAMLAPANAALMIKAALTIVT